MNNKLKKGYSLLELSISLAIIATILAAGFSMLSGNSKIAKRQDTEKRMKIIERAIASYAAIYDRIPCPADIHLSDNDSNSGVENCCNNCTNLPAHTSASGTYTIGTIPYVTLGLPEEYLSDAWDNKFIYAATLIDRLEDINMGLITVIDSKGDTRTSTAAYILMSSGGNELGSYPKSSKTYAASIPSDANELINYNSTLASGTGQFVSQEETNTYDDIVHYKQKWQIVREAGAVLSNQTCSLVKNIIKDDLAICGSNPLDARCGVLADNFILKIRELCLNQF